jgi:hypothetical protein
MFASIQALTDAIEKRRPLVDQGLNGREVGLTDIGSRKLPLLKITCDLGMAPRLCTIAEYLNAVAEMQTLCAPSDNKTDCAARQAGRSRAPQALHLAGIMMVTVLGRIRISEGCKIWLLGSAKMGRPEEPVQHSQSIAESYCLIPMFNIITSSYFLTLL